MFFILFVLLHFTSCLMIQPSNAFIVMPKKLSYSLSVSDMKSYGITRFPELIPTAKSCRIMAYKLLSSVIPDQDRQQNKRRNNNQTRNSVSTSVVRRKTSAGTTTYINNNKYNVEQEIVKLGRTGRTDQALQIFYDLPSSPTIRQINAAIDVCARARPVRLQTALDILKTYCSSKNDDVQQQHDNHQSEDSKSQKRNSKKIRIQPNVYTFGTLMNAVSNAGDSNMAVQLVTTKMKEEYGVIPNVVVYNAAISACAKAVPPRPDSAIRLIQQATERDNIQLTVNGYNAACSAAANAGDWQLAVQILESMSNPLPDAVTYGTVMSACEKCKEWEQVLLYYDKMVRDALLEPDKLSLTSALNACKHMGLPEQAKKYLNLMKEQQRQQEVQKPDSDQFSKSSDRSLQGTDAVAYRLAISACARGGAWKDAIALLNEYINTSPNDDRNSQDPNPKTDVMAYTAAIHGCENTGEWKEAFILLDQMRRNGAQPNEVTFAAVIGACATACAKISSSSSSSSSASIIAGYDTDTNKIESDPDDSSSDMPFPQRKALQLLNVLKRDPSVPKPNIQVYNAAIRACAEGLDLKRAFQLADTLLNEDGLQPTVVTYGTLMTACERVGNVQGMSKVFQLMRQQDIQPNEIIYGAAISACRKANEAERAFLLLRKLIQDGLHPNIATFNTALSAQIEDKDRSNSNHNNRSIDRAMMIYHILKSKKYNFGPNRQSYNLLIRGLNKNKQPQQAEALIMHMKKDGLKPDVDLFTTTVAAYERNGQPLRALRLMESMRQDGYDFYEASVLNDLFKKAVSLANAVGRTLTTNDTDVSSSSQKDLIDKKGVENTISFSRKDVEARLGNEMLP